MIKSLAATLFFACCSLCAMAADAPYPAKPITFIVPYPAGGALDTVARAMGEEMGKQMGQPVVVDNRPGAAGIIGTDAVAKAQGDGYTVLVTITQSILNNQFLFSRLPYDTRKELAFIGEIATGRLVLVTSPATPVHNVRELLAWAENRSVKPAYGSWGVGSYGHLTGAYLGKAHNLNLTHVPYKGEAPMVQDLIGGQITFAFAFYATVLPFIESGKLHALAVTGNQRAEKLPGVPTLAQAALSEPEYKVTGTIQMLVPIGTPAPTRVRARMQVLGVEPLGVDAKVARQNFDAMYPVPQKLIAMTGAKLD